MSVEGTTPERSIAALRARLADSFAQVSAWLDAPADTWARAPQDGGWSVGEIVEHVEITNGYLMRLCQKLYDTSMRRAERGETWSEAPPRFEHLDRVAARSFRWPHPTHMAPTGTPSRDELRVRLDEQARTCDEWLARTADGRGTLHTIRLSLLEEDDRLDLYQYLYFLGLHMRRHLAQIERTAVARRVRLGDA